MTQDTAHLLNLLRSKVLTHHATDKGWGLVSIRDAFPDGWRLRKWRGHLSQLQKLGLYETEIRGGFAKVKLED